MAAIASSSQTRPSNVNINANAPHRNRSLRKEGEASSSSSSSSAVAHTLTACTRCRQRKTRCDPGLPRCGPCERTSSTCEYYDSNKGHNVNRNYVVWLQHRVREMEEELARVENEDSAEDPEAMMRAATVRMHEAKESKFLGPSSGIAITRLVMQLAKQFTDSKSIKEIVPEHRAKQIRDIYHQEQAKPTSKIYPLISNVAAVDLPARRLTDLLLQLYKLKVQPMYPALHEPSLDQDVDAVYNIGDGATPYQQFVCRMVIAISLQKMDTQYAGLADSYYLAALKHLEPVVKPMDLKTLQCFALMAEYSLLTPTRTAIFYVVGIAVRLAQALGLNEEKTITRGRAEGRVDHLEIDMRRRLFWCVMVMEYGLSHSLGRPAMLATSLDHIDVGWFETCDDKYIKPEGVDPAAPRGTLKKWVAIHFFKMRLLQLEIRRKLYLRKRSEPRNDSDPWFIQMDAKLCAWRDAAPAEDEGLGMDRIWFTARYNTMVVFLYRPSPQVPRPSLEAATKCFDACAYNIHVQREQIARKSVDLTWIFTQSIFMAINTMLWSLSYEEIRHKHDREAVERHLAAAMDAIQLASDRWPGVASAVQLYQNLIEAIMKIYDKDGDVPISAATPSEIAVSPGAIFQDPFSRSRGASPATVASSSVATPPDRHAPPFGHIHQQSTRSVGPQAPMHYQGDYQGVADPSGYNQHPPPALSSASWQPPSTTSMPIMPQYQQTVPQQHTPQYFDPYTQYNALPEFTPELTVPGWTAAAPQQAQFAAAGPSSMHMPYNNNFANHAFFDPQNPAYPFPQTFDQGAGPNGYTQQQEYWGMDTGNFGTGLNQVQQEELMHDLETVGMEDIQSMITAVVASVTPKPPQRSTFD